MKCLTFCFNKQIIAIDIMRVQEITGVGEITHLNNHPELTNYWLNLRNRRLAVFDFRRHKIETSPETSIIVLQDKIHNLTFGLVTDSLNEIMNIPDDLIRQDLSLDDLDPIVQNTNAIKFMITIDNKNIWIMGPELLNDWQARKLYELYQ